MRANQFRMYLSGMAYVLVSGLRRLGLKATELATAQAATIREKLFKIGARVKVSVRRVWLSMASSYPSPADCSSRSGRTCAAETRAAGWRSRSGQSAGPPASEECARAVSFQPRLSRRRTPKIPHYRP